MNCHDLTHTLIESFNALADEVQNLIDRKTILEHKLRYAREQYQYLADKYAPEAAPLVSETLAKLQLPPEPGHPALNTSLVPLPRRTNSCSSDNAQLALFIREGRKVASRLSTMTDPSKESLGSTKEGVSTAVTTLSTAALEQDFTVEGRKGRLECPFSAAASARETAQAEEGEQGDNNATTKPNDPTPHASADPICAAMLEETNSQQPPPSGGAAKCPIRFLDQHSPEEIAHYVETHKHEIPRSHEVCIQRYQRNEDQIRKLDAKYGSLVGMISDLSQLHRPMLPRGETQEDVDRASNQRVEDWANEVSANEPHDHPEHVDASSAAGAAQQRAADEDDDDSRQSHFDRPLKEVRVGESPSRPWGISVPIYDDTTLGNLESGRPASPPPAPVQMPQTPPHPMSSRMGTGKCPFDHSKLKHMTPGGMSGIMSSPFHKADEAMPKGSSDRLSVSAAGAIFESRNQPRSSSTMPLREAGPQSTAHPPQQQQQQQRPQQPMFVNPQTGFAKPGGQPPQMVFTGPVFIGYPIEQAIQFMQHFQNNS